MTITEEQVIAAMKLVEEDTIQRCAALVRNYAARKSDRVGKPSSRIAAAKQIAAHEIAAKIDALPRKEIK